MERQGQFNIRAEKFVDQMIQERDEDCFLGFVIPRLISSAGTPTLSQNRPTPSFPIAILLLGQATKHDPDAKHSRLGNTTDFSSVGGNWSPLIIWTSRLPTIP